MDIKKVLEVLKCCVTKLLENNLKLWKRSSGRMKLVLNYLDM